MPSKQASIIQTEFAVSPWSLSRKWIIWLHDQSIAKTESEGNCGVYSLRFVRARLVAPRSRKALQLFGDRDGVDIWNDGSKILANKTVMANCRGRCSLTRNFIMRLAGRTKDDEPLRNRMILLCKRIHDEVKSQSLVALSDVVRSSNRTFCQIDLNQMNRLIILVRLYRNASAAMLSTARVWSYVEI